MFEIMGLRCEYQQNPIGIGVTRPRIRLEAAVG